MLHSMREGAKSNVIKFALFGLLMLAMTGLVFMDVTGTISRGFGRNNLVTYKGGRITAPEFSRRLNEITRQQKISEADAYRFGLAQQVLNGEIDKIIITRAAKDIGLEISDNQAAIQVNGIIEPLLEQGASKREALDFVLRQSGTNEAGLLEMIKQHLSKQMLVATILSNAHAPEKAIEDVATYASEKRSGKYITLTFSDIANIEKPSQEELEKFYNEVSSGYQTPEYRDFSVLVIDKDSLGINVDLSEEQIKKAYEDNIGNFIYPENRDISQTLAKDEATAKKVYDEVKAGEKLEDVAKKYELKFIETTSFTKDALPPELAEASFTAKELGLIAPIQSPLGWHILNLEKIIPSKTISYEEAKKNLKSQLEQESILNSLYETANQVDDAVAGGASLKSIAETHNLKAIDFKNVTATGKDNSKKVPIFDKVLETAFTLNQGEVSNLLESTEGAFVLVETSSVTPAQTKNLKDVKEQVQTQWLKQKQLRALSEKAASVLDKLKGGESLEKVAKSLNKEIKNTGLINRYPDKNVKDDKTNANMRKTLFSLNAVNSMAPVNSGNESLSILVFEKSKLPEFKDIPQASKDSIKNGVENEYREDIFAEYREKLLKKYGVKINYKVLERMYDDALSRNDEAQQ